MSRVFVQPPQDTAFDEFLGYAVENNCNIEIASFAYPEVLDGGWRNLVKKYKVSLKSFKGDIAIHGAFFDLNISSYDKKIRKVAEERIYQNLEIAKSLGAKYAVFHANYNVSIRGPRYSAKWIKANSDFWSKVLKKYRITVLLENFAEPAPAILRQLLDEVSSPRLKICLDTGHLNVYSKVSVAKWFSVLGKDISYLHLNDNKGDFDAELVPGKGKINWNKMSKLMAKIKPAVVLEVGTIEKTKKTTGYLKKHKIYPFAGLE